MDRELCLILDTEGYHRLVLKKGTIAEIDEYTSRYFEDGKDIKKRYQKEIDEFLDKYKEKLQKSNNPNYKGRLAIVLPEKIGKGYTEYQRSILLKKHIVVFNEYIKHKPVMAQFVSNYGKFYSESFLFSIYARWDINNTRTKINEWVKDLKKDKDVYYDTLRNFIKNYEKLRCPESENMIKFNIPTIDEVYEEYKSKKANRLSKKMERIAPTKLQISNHKVVNDTVVYEEDEEKELYIVNGYKYTKEELEQFDLDDKAEYDDDIIPDGLGNEKKLK